MYRKGAIRSGQCCDRLDVKRLFGSRLGVSTQDDEEAQETIYETKSRSKIILLFFSVVILATVASKNIYVYKNNHERELEILTEILQSRQDYSDGLQKNLEQHEVKIATLTKNNELNQIRLNHFSMVNFDTRSQIQEFSKIMLLEKYGHGPHYVEILLHFDPRSNVAHSNGGASNRIVIELAPVEEMPHTVYWFLEQVNNRLYDGYSFQVNANHLVQAGPVPNFKHLERFQEKGLSKFLFREYSKNYPHQQHTLGFAGPELSSTNFYISMEDNTDIHGPDRHKSSIQREREDLQIINNNGKNNSKQKATITAFVHPTDGTTATDYMDEADPCFAKVIFGYSAVNRIHTSEVMDSDGLSMKHNVVIGSMNIMGRKNR